MKKTLMLSIGCGVLAIILAAVYLHMKEAEVAGGSEPVQVLVAAYDIKQNALLERGLLGVKKIPRVFVQPGAITNVKEALGKVTVSAMKKGEQILGTKLVMGGTEGGLSFKVPKGKRAVSIALKSENSAGGLIQPDDYVDVVATFDYGSGDRSDKYTYLLFQNVKVLAVNSMVHTFRNPSTVAVVEKKSEKLFGSSPGFSKVETGDKVFTLLLDVDDAQRLIFAKESGSIMLVLRAPSDTAVFTDLSPVKIEEVTGKAGYIYKAYKEYKGR